MPPVVVHAGRKAASAAAQTNCTFACFILSFRDGWVCYFLGRNRSAPLKSEERLAAGWLEPDQKWKDTPATTKWLPKILTLPGVDWVLE